MSNSLNLITSSSFSSSSSLPSSPHPCLAIARKITGEGGLIFLVFNMQQIFLWHGGNDYAIQKKLAQWIAQFRKKYTGLNIVKLDALDFAKNLDGLVAELKDGFQVNSLFGSNKLIILRNFCGGGKEKKEAKKDVGKKVKRTFFCKYFSLHVYLSKSF